MRATCCLFLFFSFSAFIVNTISPINLIPVTVDFSCKGINKQEAVFVILKLTYMYMYILQVILFLTLICNQTRSFCFNLGYYELSKKGFPFFLGMYLKKMGPGFLGGIKTKTKDLIGSY